MAGAELHLAGSEPFEKDVLGDAEFWIGGKQLRDRTQGESERQSHAADAEDAYDGVGEPAADEKHQRRGYQRKQWDEPKVLEEIARGRHAGALPRIVISISLGIPATTSANPFRLPERFRGCGKRR